MFKNHQTKLNLYDLEDNCDDCISNSPPTHDSPINNIQVSLPRLKEFTKQNNPKVTLADAFSNLRLRKKF